MTSVESLTHGQKEIYDNCEIYAPNGEHVGFCNRERIKWYLSKGIAETLIGKDNAIRLKFEPKYKNTSDQSARQKRDNKCYACGIRSCLTRFHVIPREYKKLFPEEWKSHNSLDILSLCQECSGLANSYAQDMKCQLNEEYNVCEYNFIDQRKLELRTLSRKILNGRKYGLDCEPQLSCLSDILGHTVTDTELVELSNNDVGILYGSVRTPIEYIVKHIVEQGTIREFIKRWKDHFVSNMQPTDLPEDFYNDR